MDLFLKELHNRMLDCQKLWDLIWCLDFQLFMRSRVACLKEPNDNTRYFHAFIK